MQAFRPLLRYFEFSGRSGRAEFWQYLALFVVAIAMALVLDYSAGKFDPYYGGAPTITLILTAINLIPSYAVLFRRLHDVGRSGWWGGALIAIGCIETLITLITAASDQSQTPVPPVVSVVVFCAQLVLSIFLLYQTCRPGDRDANVYGPPPANEPTTHRPGDRAGAPPTSTAAPNFLTKLGQGDPLAQIERLAKLRTEGALTEDEFAQQKAELLKRL